MNTPVKFLFNEDFEQDEKAEEEAAQKLVLEELRADFNVELLQEKQKSFDEGVQAGIAQQQETNEVALKKSNEELQKCIEEINQNIIQLIGNSEQMRSSFEKRLTEYRNQSAQLAIDTAKKLAASLINEKPIENLEHTFREILNFIETELRISVSVPEKLLEEARQRIEQVAIEQGHQGRVNVIPDNSLKIGDWKLEWGAGGVFHNTEDISAQIDDALQRYITGVKVTIGVDEELEDKGSSVNSSDDSGQGEDT